MRLLAMVFGAVLAFATLVVTDAAPCRADAPVAAAASTATPAPDTAVAPRRGTDEEERAYARREAESPAAQEFQGGWVAEFLLVVVLVLVIILLAREL